MGNYRKKPVEATQWFKNGDHPEDNCGIFDAGNGPFQGEGSVVRYYRRPDVDGQSKCSHCGLIMHLHGWIDSARDEQISYNVCPGDYIIKEADGNFYPQKPDMFEQQYEPTE